MSHHFRNTPKYVYDLPYTERKELCLILDQNDKWEELGGTHMKFDLLTIQTLRRETLRGKSPTDELLTKWGHQNHTILELFVLLSKMQHYQAMLCIKQFVSSEYHRLIYEGEQNLSRLIKINRPSLDTAVPGSSRPATLVNIPSKSNHNVAEMVNLNMSETLNDVPDKVSFSRPKYDESEHKILNVDAAWNGSNGVSSAQTVVVTPDEGVAGAVGGALRPSRADLSPREHKSMSEASCLPESVGTIPQISFKELEMATNGWDSSNVLGKGGFGTVYRGTWKNTLVAVKRTRNPETDESHSVQIQQILGELKLLNSYRHDNILPLYGFSVGGEDPCLIYQLMPNGSLEDRLLCRQGTKPLSWFQRHNIATGTARGLQFLHTIGEKPLIHGDIKSANILLDLNFEPKIGDFGLAREGPYNHYTHMKVSRVHGTRPYLPDEFLRHKKFSTKVDTHSFGVVLLELATGLRAYDDQRQDKFLKDYVENCCETQLETLVDKKCGPDEHHTCANLIALAKCCVSRKPKDRPEMPAVLKELDAMAVKRDLLVRVQSMIRQNSLTPTSPYEMQVLHDHLSQQRKLSPTPTHPSNNPFLQPEERYNNNITAPKPSTSPNNNHLPALPLISPAIAISPPSESPLSLNNSLASSSLPVNATSTTGHHKSNGKDEEFMYMSQFDHVLPLIPELGIGNEEPQHTHAGRTTAPQTTDQCVLVSSAKGKSLWIVDESS